MPRAQFELQGDPVEGSPIGVAYYRVSTSEQANTSHDADGFSIQAQREYCQRKAAELGVQLVDEYVDRGKSGRTAHRPALQAMLARVKDDTDIQYVFVHKLDRLARNREDDIQIELLLIKHGVRLVSCTENIDDSPSGRLVHGIMAGIAEFYSANLSEEAKKGMRKKVEHGGTPGKAPLGYVNRRLKITELGKDIGVVRVHKRYGPIVTECFKLYDSGLCTLDDVKAYANDQGLRMPATKRLPERPVTTQQVQWLLRNRYYTGWVTFGGVEYKGEHQPLIDGATFARVQALLTARNLNKDKSRKRPHHLKGRLFCAYCGRRLGICVPTRHETGTSHAYFYCLGHQDDTSSCPQGYIPIAEIEHAVRAYWPGVRIPPDRIRALRHVILADFAGKHEQGQREIELQKRRITELQQRHKKAKTAYYAEVLDLDEFKVEQDTIRHGIKSAEEQIARWSVELASISQALDDALKLVADPRALYDALPEGLKLLFVQTVFEKIWIVGKRVAGSELTQPFAELLTLDAQLCWAERRSVGAGTLDGSTYCRQRCPMPPLELTSASAWQRPRPHVGRLRAERPRGRLAIDELNPGPSENRGSNIRDLVGVIRFKLNAELAHYLREHPIDRMHHARDQPPTPHETPRRQRAENGTAADDAA